MRIGVKSCIRMLDADVRDDKVLRKQPLLPLLNGRRMSFRVLRMLPKDVRRMLTWFNQEASSVVIPQVSIRAMLEAARNTPPQVDTSTHRNVSKALVGPIVEGDKKKKENQPKPEKLKPEKPKPDRKGDKGSRRVKRPKVQGLVFRLIQKSSGLV